MFKVNMFKYIHIHPLGIIKIIIFKSGNLSNYEYIAQSVDFDYLSCGKTVNEAIRNFIEGFESTIKENIIRFGYFDTEFYRTNMILIPENIIKQLIKQ